MAGSEIKGFIGCCGARLYACAGVSRNVITCFNYKQQSTRKTGTVVLWSRVHLTADWSHQRITSSPPLLYKL